MTSVPPKTPDEILGLEYDWLGSDGAGYVALFSTAGGGCVPKAFLRDTDAHDRAIRAILALPAVTEAKFAPHVAPGLINAWRLVAERGLYAYDGDPNGGPYRLVAAPAVPARLDSLPLAVADVAIAVGRAPRFECLTTITDDVLT